MKRLLTSLALAAGMLIAIPTQASERCNYEPISPLPGKLFHGVGGIGTICDYIEQGAPSVFPNAYEEFYGIWEGTATDRNYGVTGEGTLVIYEDYAGGVGLKVVFSWNGACTPIDCSTPGYVTLRTNEVLTLVNGEKIEAQWIGSRTKNLHTLILSLDEGVLAFWHETRKGSAFNVSEGKFYRVTPEAVAAVPAE